MSYQANTSFTIYRISHLLRFSNFFYIFLKKLLTKQLKRFILNA
nr:MAG TPA: hypothetical protein [Caudoviricetes sp.]